MSLSTFKPFQQLYQGLKSNINLFNTLDRIHNNLQTITNEITNSGTSNSIIGSVQQITYNLTGNIVISIPITTNFLFIIIIHNGFQPTFDPGTFASPITGLSSKNRSFLLFATDGILWYQVGLTTNK